MSTPKITYSTSGRMATFVVNVTHTLPDYTWITPNLVARLCQFSKAGTWDRCKLIFGSNSFPAENLEEIAHIIKFSAMIMSEWDKETGTPFYSEAKI